MKKYFTDEKYSTFVLFFFLVYHDRISADQANRHSTADAALGARGITRFYTVALP